MVSFVALLLLASPARSVELTVASTRTALEGPLLVRLTQEGFIVYPKGQPAAVKIRLADLGTELRIEVEGAGEVQAATVVVRADESPAELQLEVTQKAVALASAARFVEPPAPAPPAPQVKAPTPAADVPRPVSFEVRLDVGLLSGEFIALPIVVQGGLRVGRAAAAHLIAGVFPASGDAPGPSPGFLVAAGVGYRFNPVWRLELEPVLLGGIARYNESYVEIMATPGLLAGLNVTESVRIGLRSLFSIRLADVYFRGPGYCVDLGLFLSFRFW